MNQIICSTSILFLILINHPFNIVGFKIPTKVYTSEGTTKVCWWSSKFGTERLSIGWFKLACQFMVQVCRSIPLISLSYFIYSFTFYRIEYVWLKLQHNFKSLVSALDKFRCTKFSSEQHAGQFHNKCSHFALYSLK